jgi:hypothetical protein
LSSRELGARAFREFPFAPEVLTVCARSVRRLEQVMGSSLIPVIRTKLRDLPFGTYILDRSLSGHPPRFSVDGFVTPRQISLDLPTTWLGGYTDGASLYGLAAMPREKLLELQPQIVAQGFQLVAMPIPKGLVV